MSLTSGTKLGPYEILAAIGAGGMGEVYKARDTRLDRTVAIKVLPEHLASNGELLQRFEREARSISSLNHANICVLHDVGEQSGVHFLVMEYIEGESLSQRLARGPIATPELIRIGTQIADALDKAHRQGLVHRDLKPGNIMLTKSGAKLLDFGLAKARGALATSASGHDAALTQTKAASGPITEQGRVVGTFQYMSPEQVEGREADARSDIFAFGAVLYEMATGRRAFEGRSSISIASAILEKEPEPISSVQPMTPPGLEQVVRTCLAKDPEERWQSAADIGRQLRWVSESGSQAAATMLPAKVRRRRLERVAWASGVGLLLAAVGVLAWMSREPGTPLHAEFAATNGLTFDFMGDVAAPPALSPDGTMVVFGAHTDKEPQGLYVRSLRTGAVQRLAGTESGIFPFWSPDSKFIGFFGDGKIEKTAAAGGPVSIITATDTAPRGGCWTEGNEILFTPDYARPLFRVSASGGTPTELTKLAPNHTTHRWPVCLPDGKHFLYYATNHSSPAGEQNGIYFGAMGGKEDKFVVASDAAALYANGYLLYHQQNELIAQKFDAGTGTLSGDPRPLADLVTYDPGTWHLLMTVSANGELLYQRGVATAGGTQFEWADRSGKPLQQLGTPAGHNGFSISPDGKRVVTSIIGRLSDIYILDSQTGLATRLTFDPTNHVDPSWSPDGTKIVYADDQNLGSGPLAAALHVKAANGTGADQEVYRPAGGAAVWPQYTRDGQNIVFMYVNGPTGWQVETIPASGGKPAVVVKPQTPQANVSQFDVSPDEKWIAYSSNDTGTAQVYVSSFPSGSGRWQVSTNGGIETMWSRKSKELFFLGTDFNLYSAHYNDDGGQFAITAIQQVMAFHNVPPSGKSFEISPDGSKFLLDIASQQSSAPLTLVVNWPSDLKN